MAKRLVLFVDYQNVYRQEFFTITRPPLTDGQIHPDALGHLIA